jgi:farnesol dehydrogenase
MRVLVTGGTGFLGRAVVRELARRGHEPVVFARSADRAGLPGRAVPGDVRDEAGLRAAAAGCDAVIHMAALVSVWRRRRLDFDDVNVGGLENVLRLASVLPISRIVYTSSFLALPPSDTGRELRANDYQRTKVDAHRVALQAIARGAPLLVLYPGVVYGPGVRTEGNLVGGMIADHLRRRLPGVIGADRRWSYAYADDVARGHAEALERGCIGAQYRLCGENAPQMRVFEIVRELTGRALPWSIPYSAAWILGAAEEARAAVFNTPPLLTRGVVDIFRREWAFDSDRAIAELGYSITPLREGVARTVEDIRREAGRGSSGLLKN